MTQQQIPQWLKKIGYAYFFIFILLSLYYFKERVIYVDSANQVFEMINKGWFQIFVGRYSMILSQLLPLAAIKLHMSLRVILVVYSVSFGLIFLFAYYLCVEHLKNLAAGLMICITFVSASATFFHALSESLQVIAYVSLLYAWLQWVREKNKFHKPALSTIVITTVLLALNFFIHPISLFTVTFVIGYVFFDELKKFDLRITAFAAFWVLIFIIKAMVFSKGSHDEAFLGEINNTTRVLGGLMGLYPLTYLKLHFLQFFLIPFIMWILLLIKWIREKRFSWLIVYNLFLGLFMLLTLIIYNKGDSDQGMERSFLPFLLFVALPFLTEILVPLSQAKKLNWISIPIFAGLTAVGIANICSAAPAFELRVSTLQSWINTVKCAPGNKFIIKQGKHVAPELMVTWNTAVETMLLSSIDDPSSTKTFFVDRNMLDSIPYRFKATDFYYTPWHVLRPSKDLNNNYYSLSGGYSEFLSEYKKTVSYFFDLENRNAEANLFFDNSGNSCVAIGASSEKAFSGNTSVKLEKGLEFGLQFAPTIMPGDIIAVSVKRLGSQKASLVLTDENGFYINTSKITLINGWEQLQIDTVLPAGVDWNAFKIYVWSTTGEVAYFDDLKVEIISTKK